VDAHRAIYRIEVTCTRRMRRVLIIATGWCIGWMCFLAAIAVQPALAQTSQWMQRTEDAIRDTSRDVFDVRLEQRTLSVQVSGLRSEFQDFRATALTEIAALRALETRTLYALLGLLAASVGVLVGVLWNLRTGWLKVKAE
jgi:hypothetical protein